MKGNQTFHDALVSFAERRVIKMNTYITGAAIKRMREKQCMTQHQLAEKLCVSDKTISKWETGVPPS